MARGRARTRGSSKGRGSSSREESRGGRGKRGGNKDFPFTKLGSLTASKDTDKELGDVIDDLIENKAKFWCKVYLPKGVDSITLEHEAQVLISFNPHKDDPPFVLGTVLLKDED